MIRLNKGDKVAIVSLSSGILGENFCSHQVKLGVKRLEELGLQPVFMENTLKGMEFIANHPNKRVEDLITAFRDESIKGIICAIGGVDTYKTLEYIIENEEYMNIIKNNSKFFMGYSDTTTNHLMLYKLGLNTFYGLSFLTDFAELDKEMLPYTKEGFLNIFTDKPFKYTSSPLWYEERKDFSEKELNKSRITHNDNKGFELLQGNSKFSGKLFGGCIDVFYEYLVEHRFKGHKRANDKYNLIPDASDLKEYILFLETAENKLEPKYFKDFIQKLKDRDIFNNINGMILAKPQDEAYYNEYKEILIKELREYNISVAINFNFGHSYPKMLLQYGAMANVDTDKNEIIINRL